MRVSRSFTTPGYWPRSDPRSTAFEGATLDIVYNIESQELPGPPAHSKLNLLFVHGAQLSKECWKYWIDLAFEEWGGQLDKCILMDHVHHGDSAVVNRGRIGYYIPWDDMGRDVGMVIRDCIRRGEIDASAPLIVVAHSMGGAASLCLSVFDPGLVTALVLADPVWMGADAKQSEIEFYDRTLARLSFAVYRRAVDEFENLESYYEYMDKKYLTAKMQPRIKKDLSDALYRVEDGKIKLKMSRAFQAAAYYGGLSVVGLGQSIIHRVSVPVVLFHGDTNDFNPPGSNESLEEILQKAERKEIPGGGHLVPFTKPEESFEAIKGFISREYNAGLERRGAMSKHYGSSPDESFMRQLSLKGKSKI